MALQPMYMIFGIPVSNLSLSEAAQKVVALCNIGGKHMVVTLNPEMAVEAYKRPKYQQVLAHASLIVPDGIGIVFASLLSREPLLKGVVRGRELAFELFKICEERGLTLVLLGADIDVLHKTTLKITSTYHNIRILNEIVGPQINAESGKAANVEDDLRLVSQINEIRPDILLVGFGHPKQELWLGNYMESLDIKVGIGVGGTFDYISGEVPVPPSFIKKMGVEWVWRLCNQPNRIFRIVKAVIVFPILYIFSLFKLMFHVEH